MIFPALSSSPSPSCCSAGSAQEHASLLAAAEEACARAARPLTPLRLRLLSELARATAPLGAYELLERLNRDSSEDDPPLAPSAAYRVLGFWRELGFVHQVVSQSGGRGGGKAWVVCRAPAHSPASDADPEAAPKERKEAASATGSHARGAARAGALSEASVGFFLCDRCGHAHEFHEPRLAALAEDLSAGFGFALSGGVVEFTGVCRDCGAR